MRFKLIPAGRFVMGSSRDEIDRALGMSAGDEVLKLMLQSEGPEHDVEITKPFYMGTTEVTVGQFRKFVAANRKYGVGDDRWREPGFPQSDEHPVVWVSWQNAIDFCNWLTDKEGKKYRLPTEAEWEYSCRAGKPNARFGYGNDDAELESYAWFDYHSGNGTHRVGDKQPNAWGLYDMHGNVFEWCQDWHGLDHYKSSVAKDPIGSSGTTRVTRGGGWSYPLVYCRTAFRSWLDPAERRECVGFRVVLGAPPDEHRRTAGK
jgi:formylglycine-generating enzyme required for sulfatase activity